MAQQKKPGQAAPPDEKKQETKPRVGHVKWYKMDKGYGFIMLYPEYLHDGGGDQILVLKSSIRSDPARGLKEREIVDFEIGVAVDGKEVAVNLLRVSDCYTCGKDGHVQRNCPLTHPRRNGSKNGEGMCYNCKEVGHMARNCANPCHKCNELGHMPKGCPNSSSKANGSSARQCFKCGDTRHIARDCASNPSRKA